MISTRHLDGLPSIVDLKHRCQSLALLNVLFYGDDLGYLFDAHWGQDEQLASMIDGFGNHYFILFSPAGAIIKGFDHESPMTSYRFDPPRPWPGVVDHVPSVWAGFLADPRIEPDDISFCIWRMADDSAWRIGSVEFPTDGGSNDYLDGSEWLLPEFEGTPKDDVELFEDVYEGTIPLVFVEHIFRYEPLTDDILAKLGSDVSMDDLAHALWRIGYPTKT